MAFVLWSGITLIWTPNLVLGLNAYWQVILMVGVFALGSSIVTLRPVLIALGIGFGINGALVLMQGLWWNPFKYLQTPGNPEVVATFINGNLLAECAALTFIGCTAYRLWWCLPGLLPAIILPWTNGTPRAPLVAITVSGLFWLWRRRPLLAVHLLGFATIIGASVIGGHGDSLGQRFNIWSDTLRGLTPFGHGLGSYYVSYPAYAERQNTLLSRPENAHNDYLEIIYELGIPGAILLAYLIGIAWRSSRQPERYMFIGVLVVSAFGFPLHMPMGQFMAALIAGRLCGDWLPLRASLSLGRIRVYAWFTRVVDAYGGSRSFEKGGEFFSGISSVFTRCRQLLHRHPLERVSSASDRSNQGRAEERSFSG